MVKLCVILSRPRFHFFYALKTENQRFSDVFKAKEVEDYQIHFLDDINLQYFSVSLVNLEHISHSSNPLSQLLPLNRRF